MTYSVDVGQLLAVFGGGAAVLVGLVAWFIRLEAKVKSHDEKIQSIKEDHHESHSGVWEKLNLMNTTLTQILQSIARMEGRDQRESEK